MDLENCGAKVATLNSILEKVKIRGDILLGKVYGYTDRFSDLKEILLSNTFTVVPSLRYGISQKNNADIQLVIDALEVAYKNELIDSFCIVSGDSDYTPLVGRLKAMGKFVLGISRSEAASTIFINACNEFVFLESVAAKKQPKPKKGERIVDGDLNELIGQVETIVEDQDEEQMYASELKDTLTRLRPDFSERSYGCSTFGIYRKIILPLSQNGLATLTVLTFNSVWNDYMGPMIYLDSDRLKTIQLGLASFQQQFSADYGAIMAGTVCSVIPIIIVYCIGQKYIVEGVAFAGVKG